MIHDAELVVQQFLASADWADDGANSSVYSVANFELLPKPQLDPPPAISPINNAQTATRSPQLIVGASTRNAAVTSVIYEFQLASDAAVRMRRFEALGNLPLQDTELQLSFSEQPHHLGLRAAREARRAARVRRGG